MSKLNVLFLFSDEHRRDALGCFGHNLVQTPNLDKLAANGTRFSNAYTDSPVCVPARASVAAGEYVYKTRCWSNAQGYQGEPKGWGHRLQSQGHRVDSIGKLHYRGKEYDNGFDNEILPLYDESAAVPMIIAGPGIPENKLVSTLASLVDIYPTIVHAVGAEDDGKKRPGIALQKLANKAEYDRPILSEYHDGGSPTGMFMLRNANWKYNYYPGNVPEAANKLAFADQAAKIKELGGIEAILNSDEFDFTPVGS